MRLPDELEVRDTAWAEGSVTRAHQALLRYALTNFKNAEWFILVSGDSIPLKSQSTVLESLKLNTSKFDFFAEESSHMQWAAMNEALLQCNEEKNWWKEKATERGEDEEGEFFVLPPQFAQTAHANHVLCRVHAEALAKMPDSVSVDFDALVSKIGG